MRRSTPVLALVCLGWLISPDLLVGQDPGASDPIVGVRDTLPQVYALEHVDIVVRPGKTITDGTIVVRDGSIISVGAEVEIPAGAERLDRTGHTVYPGLIDAYSEVEVADPSRDSGAPHWNGNVMPQRSASAAVANGVADGEKLRSQGITVRLVAPEGGIIKGSSSVILVGDGTSGDILMGDHVFQHLTLTVPRRRGGVRRDDYPNSPMGAVALLRQTMLDAQWYASAMDAYRADGRLPKPKHDTALETLGDAMRSMTFVVDAANERMAQRADLVAKEFRLNIIVRGSGREYRQLDEIAQDGHAMLIPVDFADAPKINNESDARETSLQELMDWELAPSNPARLANAGVTFCLTTDGLSDVNKFLEQVRKAVEAGLDADTALAALTTTPANLLGIEAWAGTVEAGKLANFLVTDGDLFDTKTKAIETWVAGKRYEVTAPDKKELESIEGSWVLTGPFELDEEDETESLKLVLKKKGASISGTLSEMDDDEQGDDEDGEEDEEGKNGDEGEDEADDDEDEEASIELSKVTRERDRLTAAVDLSELDDDFATGISWISMLTSEGDDGLEIVDAKVTLPSGRVLNIAVAKAPEEAKDDDSKEDESSEDDSDAMDAEGSDDESKEQDASDEMDDSEDGDAEDGDAKEGGAKEGDDAGEVDAESDIPEIALVYPLGAYGVTGMPEQKTSVLFRGATVWTCGESGILEKADVLVVDGKIAAVGPDLEAPEGCEVVDVTGKHLTPGLIDCHSHMATDGGVNESGQTITAEVRIQDFIDNSDITIYRQLAGGLTTANILHGSANPIGGQNQVIKLRWGGTMEQMLFQGAPKGIKFALGENVKRTEGRYPDTRMGVEQIMRDQLLAAGEYADAHRRYRNGDRSMLPPRVDLQLEAIAEILAGERWVHCHSYRQDEIVALLDTLDEFGVQIGSLQHILEGYKVADRMAQHGATASSFSDWWAYKFEVFDAIPQNGALMHDAGIVVSFNSDDAELARHMNTEAAKAVKYGGVSPEEALKFVTLNPAKQLRIDDRVGSIEVGKDADLAIWSRQPLSTMTRCEQTWVDGRCYFSLEKDAEMRARDARWHAYLVQKALGGKVGRSGARKERIEEEDRWHRHDIYCGHHDHEEAIELSTEFEHMHLEEAGQ
jgi:imidazolonepropionase-like amidohydrolase